MANQRIDRSRSGLMLVLSLATAALLTLPAPVALGHGGGLNAEGCHNNSRSGDYHCHQGKSRSALAPVKRSTSARSAFRQEVPCPVTDSTIGSCPGWEVDHVIPLACGGADEPGNMQWLTQAENRSKGDLGCSRR